jgi:hypothetical protein
MVYYKLVVRTKVSVNPELDPSTWFLNEEGHEKFSEISQTYGYNNFKDCLQTYFDEKIPGERISIFCVTYEIEPVVYKRRGVIKAIATDEHARDIFTETIEDYFLNVDLEVTEIGDINFTPLRRKRDLSRRL